MEHTVDERGRVVEHTVNERGREGVKTDDRASHVGWMAGTFPYVADPTSTV